MPFNPVGRILCLDCEVFVDGDDCKACGWQQEPHVKTDYEKIQEANDVLDDIFLKYLRTNIPDELKDLLVKIGRILED